MTRINDRLLVQSPDGEWVVVMDESGGEEILLSPGDVIPVIRALQYFAGEQGWRLVRAPAEPLLHEVRDHVAEDCIAADLSEGSG